jgi:hypothetical protein
VIKGRLKFAFADGNEELDEAGDAYYAAPGHVPTLSAGTDVVEFSPTAELQKTLDVVSKTWRPESADDGQAAINASVGRPTIYRTLDRMRPAPPEPGRPFAHLSNRKPTSALRCPKTNPECSPVAVELDACLGRFYCG